VARVQENREIEIKLIVQDVRALRVALKRLRAREISPRTYESNTLYDTKNGSLASRGRLVRLRIEKPESTRRRTRKTGTAVLTYKGPLESASRADSKPSRESRYKVREEVEIVLNNQNNDGAKLVRILHALGFREVFQYEKFRTTYSLPHIASLKVEFDETPIGLFLELEGTPRGIDRAAKRLGYRPSDYIVESYGALYLAACRRNRIRPTNMLFAPTTKLR
jgi:adenylate cyclase, class 2